MTAKTANLVDGKYSITDLVDSNRLREMFQRFSRATGYIAGIMTHPDQELIVHAGLRDICTKFHRDCESSRKLCLQFDQHVADSLDQSTNLLIEPCEHGLYDGAAPIIIDGFHIANLLVGQVLVDKPDENWYRERALHLGYDVESYLTALRAVPIASKEELQNNLLYLVDLVNLLCEQGLAKLRSTEITPEFTSDDNNFRKLFECSTDANLIIENEVFIDCNQATIKMLGYDNKREFLNNVHPAVLSPPKQPDGRDSVEKAEELMAIALEKGSHRFEWSHMRKDGSIFPVEVLLTAITNTPKSRVLHTVWRDISIRKQSEKTISNLADFNKGIVESAPVGIVTLDEDGKVTSANRAFLKIVGSPALEYTEELNLNIPSLLYSKLGDKFKSALEYGNDFELRNIPYTSHWGKDLIINIKGVTKYGVDNTLNGIIIVVEDVTSSVTAEAALRESENKLRSVIEHSNDAIYILQNDRFILINKKFTELTGLTAETTQKPDFSLMDYVAPESRELINEREKMRAEGKNPPNVYEFTILDVNGNKKDVQTSINIIEYDNDTAIIGSLRDLTEYKRLQKQLNQAQKLESIGRLAGGIAHDLNNLLTPILGYSDILYSQFSDADDRKETAQVILDAGKRARDMVRQLLVFSKKQAIDVKPIEINDLILNFEKLLRRTIRDDVVIKVMTSEDNLMIKGDVGQLEQIIMNLSINAQDAMPEGGILKIETSLQELGNEYIKYHRRIEPGSYALIEVTDTGSGISPENLEHIYEPFFTTKPTDKGTGLGLATVYGIVEKHGGHIMVYSEIGIGTTFKVYLPLTDNQLENQDLKKVLAESTNGSEKILLIEDNKEVRKLTYRILKHQGYDVIEADDANHALEYLKENMESTKLILTDVIMPEMNGKELYEEVRKLKNNIKVLFMSGYADDIISEKGLLEDGLNFIQKPFTSHVLSSKIREILDQ